MLKTLDHRQNCKKDIEILDRVHPLLDSLQKYNGAANYLRANDNSESLKDIKQETSIKTEKFIAEPQSLIRRLRGRRLAMTA